MPELLLFNPNGTLRGDAEARVKAAMHFPTDQSKRAKLQSHYELSSILEDIEPEQEDSDKSYTLHSSDIQKIQEARPLKELEQHTIKLYQNGFISAHWLIYRLYSSQNGDDLGSNGKWYSYVEDHLMKRLNANAAVRWASTYESIRKAKVRFSSVAHLWAACVYEDPFTELLKNEPEKLGQSTYPLFGFGLNFDRKLISMLQRAQSYLQAAQSINLFGETDRGDTGTPINAIWTIPSEIIPVPLPNFEHPDRFVVNFNPQAFAADYKSRFHTSKGN